MRDASASKLSGGPQLETCIWQVLIGLEHKAEASIKQPQTEIKHNMLVTDYDCRLHNTARQSSAYLNTGVQWGRVLCDERWMK